MPTRPEDLHPELVVAIEARFADVLRQQADGHWLMVVDNGADVG